MDTGYRVGIIIDPTSSLAYFACHSYCSLLRPHESTSKQLPVQKFGELLSPQVATHSAQQFSLQCSCKLSLPIVSIWVQCRSLFELTEQPCAVATLAKSLKHAGSQISMRSKYEECTHHQSSLALWTPNSLLSPTHTHVHPHPPTHTENT